MDMSNVHGIRNCTCFYAYSSIGINLYYKLRIPLIFTVSITAPVSMCTVPLVLICVQGEDLCKVVHICLHGGSLTSPYLPPYTGMGCTLNFQYGYFCRSAVVYEP